MLGDRVRLQLEEEESRLSPFAQRSRLSQGRRLPEEPSPLRTEYMRDRDRIIHSKAFRRLKHKTQVFIAPVGDHYVTRLTHTIEVSQVARTISRALRLNEDLTEAIALGHDLGHTPFGHIGEEVLDTLLPGGFHHAEQSLRIVDELEKEGQGLNLTWEVRQGILHHSKGRLALLGPEWTAPDTLEAQVCKLADSVAYVNHDIGDAVRAGYIIEEQLPAKVRQVLGTRHSERLNTIVTAIVEESWAARGETSLPQGERPAILMAGDVLDAVNELREFLFRKVYLPSGQSEDGRRARETVHLLWDSFTQSPETIPSEYGHEEDTPERRVADYISGMTDGFALRAASALRPERPAMTSNRTPAI
ncbi:MAG: deoxyguanosinetriphosphate triphosphohydrolase [Chloroflexi bacterium]|nr:deoxyguanosinetriphosphate triphosphohydrolase [Chloroflexota bacterium]